MYAYVMISLSSPVCQIETLALLCADDLNSASWLSW